jgi:lipopolysaccharide transport system permease protein
MKNLKNYRDLLIVLTNKEIKIRYKNSLLGYFWSIANPLAFSFVFFIAFKVVMKIDMENYTLFLISGLFPWQWFSNSMNASPMIFLGNASIIKKVNFPRNIIPLATILQDMLHFILSIPVITIFLFIYHKSPSLSWLYGIPFLLSIQLFMVYGLSLMVSSINLFFRDMEKLVGILITLLFYFTPIIYPERMIPERLQYLINFNPLAPLMISWRNMFINGTVEPVYLMVSSLFAIVAFTAGFTVYRKLSWKFAEVL